MQVVAEGTGLASMRKMPPTTNEYSDDEVEFVLSKSTGAKRLFYVGG
jgi:hypothetical protein